MAEADATACRRNAAHWEERAAEATLENVRGTCMASAKAWTERAEHLERTADLRLARLKAAQ